MKKILVFYNTFSSASGFVILFACSARTTPINVDADGVALKGYDRWPDFTLNVRLRDLKISAGMAWSHVAFLPTRNI